MSRPPLPFRPSAEPAPDAEVPRSPNLEAVRPAAQKRPSQPPTLLTLPPDPALGLRPDADPLAAFEPEDEIRYKTQRRSPSSNPGVLVIVLAIGVIGGILALTYLALRRPTAAPVQAAAPAPAVTPTGQAQFDSRPTGAEVVIDGVARGKTPIKLSLPVGEHALEIRGEAGTRSIPLTIEAGVLVSQYVELVAAPDQATGRLEISSDPSGAQVRLDGVSRGVTPLTIDAVEARSHNLSLSRGSSTVYRSVRVTPGATATVFAALDAVPVPTAGAVGGFVSLAAPFELQVFEGGRLLGTTSADRLMLPTGRHALELVSDAFQFRTSVDVDVVAGKTATSTVSVPNGSLSVNALPWAEVFVDGRTVGTTPLANLEVPVGNHEVTWRHPQLGERRQAIAVTAQTPVRVGVNFAQ